MADFNEVFLATTALESFWITSKPIIFLSEACCRYSRRQYWRNLNGTIFKSPWEDYEKGERAYVYVNSTYESLLPRLGDALNRLHATNHGVRYWRILIGPWLVWYVSAVYDRYNSLKQVLSQHPGLTTIVLAEESFVVPKDSLNFLLLLKGDGYNLQLYSKILALLGMVFPSRPASVKEDHFAVGLRFKFPKRILRVFLDAITRISKPRVIIDSESSFFSRLILLKIMAKTKLRVAARMNPFVEIPGGTANKELRMNLRSLLRTDSSDEFLTILSAMMADDIPLAFVEAYRSICEDARKTQRVRAKTALTASGWYFDEELKFSLADLSENGGTLLACQHGGGYGSLAYGVSELHETQVADVYYTWGWKKKGCKSSVRPMPAQNLIGLKKRDSSRTRGGILFVTTSVPRYLDQFPLAWGQQEEYFEWQQRFLESISLEARGLLRLRPHKVDVGWDLVERWKDAYPGVAVEGWEEPFIVSAQRSLMVVCDHNSTTLLQTIATDIPTVLFWNPVLNKLRAEAESYFQGLHHVGVLHYSPENAARMVEVAFHNAEEWWHDTTRQLKVEEFRKVFARTSAKPVDEWASELKSVAHI